MSKDNLAEYYFHQGTNFRAYEHLGCNRIPSRGKYLYSFRVWAPNASEVRLISDFTDWDNGILMTRSTDQGIWELIYSSVYSLEGLSYKYKIVNGSDTKIKGDPYARYSKGLADGASIIYTKSAHKWNDKAWIKHRDSLAKCEMSHLSYPINIYELHLGSFLKDNPVKQNYRDLADIIAPYVKHMGYTHIELLPIMEHPYDGSWGYQVCGFYAPTSRYGSPDDFRYFIDKMHSVGIGVILDWVPAHFPKDAWGLYEFDGQPLYEYQGVDRQESASWGTRFFDLGREEVQSFLISNALYYFREFHIDGLRVDAVASILYLDYDRRDGEWIPNNEGTNISLEGVAFLKKLNTAVFKEFPSALMIAEESGDYGRITHPVYNGGLGFNLKWNMGWANDFYEYMSTDPIHRKHHHKALTFPLMYAFGENYCLPISHDEVVHGKKSFIDKMHGAYSDKFLQARIALILMMTYPGKKLLFMGTEYAQFREWDYSSSLEWFMLDYENHAGFREFVRELNHFYLREEALWFDDFSEYGFEWILPNENDKNTVVYKRYDGEKEPLIIAINFSGISQNIRIPTEARYSLDVCFASTPTDNKSSYTVEEDELGDYYADITLNRFSAVILRENSKTYDIKL